MQKLTNEGYSAKSSALDNFCIGHWVVTDKFIGNSDSPIGWQQAKNMRDHVILEFAQKTKNSVKQVVHNDLDKLISQATKTKRKYLLVIRDYTFKIGQFIPALNKFVENDLDDAVIVGHILDWKDQYYEIHHQAFILDLEWYITVGKPSFKEGWHKAEWQATDVERSVENFHAPEVDHTPLWIKSKGVPKTYNKWRHGALVIAKAMEQGRTVKPFPDYVRNEKTYLYPELKNEHYHHFQNYLENIAIDQYFAVNTETVYKDAPNSEYDIMFVPASGIFALVSPYLNQLNVGGELVVFDVNAITIKYAQYLDRWPGPTTDIALYIEKFIGEYDVFPRVGTPEQIQKTKQFIEQLGPEYADWYAMMRPYIRRTMHKVDFMFFEQYKHMIDVSIDRYKHQHPEYKTVKVFINISNIFHYPPNSFLYSLRYRTEVLNKILEYNNSLENVTFDYCYVGLDVPSNLVKEIEYKEH